MLFGGSFVRYSPQSFDFPRALIDCSFVRYSRQSFDFPRALIDCSFVRYSPQSFDFPRALIDCSFVRYSAQVFYFRQGHELYVKEVFNQKVYDINPKKQCFYKMQLRVRSWTPRLGAYTSLPFGSRRRNGQGKRKWKSPSPPLPFLSLLSLP